MPYRNFLLDAVHEGLTWNIPNEVSADAVKAQAGLMANLLQTRRVHGERSRLFLLISFSFPASYDFFFQQYKLAPGSCGWPCTYGVGRGTGRHMGEQCVHSRCSPFLIST
ncbi:MULTISPECIES: hypothetical protein [Nitrosomonas]|uniref:hypothetical protein n=1 Tax=Nitrosomonas TaxID=914 RepID=UPI0011875F37|nr:MULTISPECIES: hypothetical protein [Nitrosomonas]UVS60466.1 hypothetical protein NX761_13230 [Nitrosomonas sp. PLL12]